MQKQKGKSGWKANKKQKQILKKGKTGRWVEGLTSFGCQTQVCVRRGGLPTVRLGRWKGISLVFQRGWGSWWVRIGVGVFTEGNPARRRWRDIKPSCAEGRGSGQHRPSTRKEVGRPQPLLSVELGVRPDNQLLLTHSPFSRQKLSALKQLISQVKKQKSMKWKTKG
jgi:hypothetical protein